jgi:predicted membrane-bound spermidine synthase
VSNKLVAYKLAAPLSFLTGFLSLSQEIIWIRWVGFGHGGMPQSFSFVLAIFLIGIAVGALIGKRRCARSTNLVFDSGFTLLMAGCFDALALFLAPIAMFPHPVSAVILIILVGFTAGIKGVVFPIVHQMGTTGNLKRVGHSFSRVYAANIAGATLGPLVTGFVLLSFFSAFQIYLLICLISLSLGILILAMAAPILPKRQAILTGTIVTAAMASLFWVPDPVVQVAAKGSHVSQLIDLIQNRQGIVHTVDTKLPGGLTTYGGNIYDGRTGFDMSVNANRLDRAYFAATLHPNPKTVLIIGLSTGAWTKVIAGMPGIEHIDVIEINPAYAALIEKTPDLKDVLKDKRIKIHWDDGRRWLVANPQAKYDLIFQNTTFHWRSYVSLLLSEQYLTLAKVHLNLNGIMAVNTTDSLDVQYTISKTFPNSVKYLNFVYASTDPIIRRTDARLFLESSTVLINGLHAQAFTPEAFLPSGVGDDLLNAKLLSVQDYIAQTNQGKRNPLIITDWNLLTEYRYGRSLWTTFFK